MRSLKWLAGFFLAFCGYWYVRHDVIPQVTNLAAVSDFTHYYRAAQAILSGRSPFADTEYLYPALMSFIVAPFGLTDYVSARLLWFLLLQTCLLGAAWILWRFLGRGWLAAVCIGVVWAFGGAAEESLALGQVGAILALVFTVSMASRKRLGGAAAGFGFALKYIPGLLAIPLIFSRNRSALRSFACTGLTLLIVPWIVVWAAFSGPVTPVSGAYMMGTPALMSWSVPSVALRALDRPQGNAKLPYNWEFGNMGGTLKLPRGRQLISAATAAVTLGAGLLALLLVTKAKLKEDQVPWVIAALISLSLAASPVAWTHYQIFQYPGAAMLLVYVLRRRWWLGAAAALACLALLYPVPVAVLRAYFNAHGVTAYSPATLYLWTSVTPLASLALFGLFLHVATSGATLRDTGSAAQPEARRG